ncbi:GNAT family N-acetyltransferase [Acholeplasma granularum]|uniref:GNAT family N-acetyltransferase n=1 Tax=Acholeplasma granularum TaxID=264635 RepID=UPI000472220E|nr:GNAT family N-acetyltransferase [Acholeplasma granularum]
MKEPIIYFENYLLRPVQIEDANDMYEYGSDLETVKFLSWGPYMDVTEAHGSIKQFFLKRPQRGLPIGYAIVDLKLNKMIGTIDFHTIISDGVAEIGFCLNKAYWKKGIMTKALHQILQVGFYYHGFKKIVIGHANQNTGSKRVIEKNKFIFDYVDNEKYYNRFTGQNEPSSWYYLTREDFIKNEF